MVDTTLPSEILVTGNKTFADVNDDVSRPLENFPTGRWWACFAMSGVALLVWLWSVSNFIYYGQGVLGLNEPSGWGTDITNFVFWVGIGHAGTLISAILFLFRQKWRTAINRSAEAMTIFAVITALTFPLLHTGRPWYAAFWLLPYPNQRHLWVNFRSPLLWDVFAVSTYFTISLVFWFVGLIPDLASVRDRAKNGFRRGIYTVLSMGWRGSNKNWSHYEMAYLILAGLSTPLVLSVHTIVSFDFAVSLIPGWHTTIFPPYFVAGAVYSGFAMVLTLAIPIRKWYHLEDLVTTRHLDNMAKVMLATGSIVAYGYAMEVFMSWYSASHWEFFMMWNRMFGPMGWAYWILILTNIAIPLTTLWSRKLRVNVGYLFFLSFVVNIGMWFERFVIVVTSLYRDYLPSSWGTYRATKWDYMLFIGTWGFFTFLFLLFARIAPMIPMSEIKMILPQTKVHPMGADAETVAQEAL